MCRRRSRSACPVQPYRLRCALRCRCAAQQMAPACGRPQEPASRGQCRSSKGEADLRHFSAYTVACLCSSLLACCQPRRPHNAGGQTKADGSLQTRPNNTCDNIGQHNEKAWHRQRPGKFKQQRTSYSEHRTLSATTIDSLCASAITVPPSAFARCSVISWSCSKYTSRLLAALDQNSKG